MEVAPLLQPLDEQTRWRARLCGRCDAEWVCDRGGGSRTRGCSGRGKWICDGRRGLWESRPAWSAGLAIGETDGFMATATGVVAGRAAATAVAAPAGRATAVTPAGRATAAAVALGRATAVATG